VPTECRRVTDSDTLRARQSTASVSRRVNGSGGA
jgi:hypothetical protein